MSTKAEEFRYWLERSGSKKGKRASGPARNGSARASPAAVASGSKQRESIHAGRKAAYALEDTAGKPSRRSTRKSSNRLKTDSQTRAKRWVAEVRPESRTRGR